MGLRGFLRDEGGGPALEFVLFPPAYVLVVLGIIGVGLLMWVENSIQFAAEAAARCASVDFTSCDTVTKIQDAAIGWANGVPITRANVPVNLGVACTAGITGNAVAIRYSVSYFVLTINTAAEACFPKLS